MALFKNRPLALASFLAVTCALLSFFLPTWLLILSFLLVSIALLAFLIYALYKHPAHIWITIFMILCMLLLMLLRIGTDRVMVQSTWERHMDASVTAEVRVREVRYATAYETELLVDTTSIDGTRFHSKAILRTNDPITVCEGDRIAAQFEVKDLSYDAYTKGMEYTYMGEGAKALLVMEKDAYMLQESGVGSLAFRLASLRSFLSNRITKACEGEAGNLLASLLIGTRSKLSDTTVRDFGRIGVSHLLALSGLHLSVLAGIFDTLLLFLRCKKTTRTIVIVLVCFAYLALTGFHYSMLRAVIMLLFVYLAFWYKTDYDAITTLCFCAALFTLITPGAIFSVSFRLTFLATLGVLMASELTRNFNSILPKKWREKKRLIKCIRYVALSLVVSTMSTVMVLPVLWLTFGEVSVMAPLANLLLIPIAPLLLFGAILVLLIPIAPIGILVSLPAHLVLYVTNTLSRARASCHSRMALCLIFSFRCL